MQPDKLAVSPVSHDAFSMKPPHETEAGIMDRATLRSCYDDLDNRWAAYTKILGRVRELAGLTLTPDEVDQQEQFVDRLVERMVAMYDMDTLREVCEFVQEQRQQAAWPAPRFIEKPKPTALEVARSYFLFVAGLWIAAKKPNPSGNPALKEFCLMLGHRPLLGSDELHVLLSEEHTLARRAVKEALQSRDKHDNRQKVKSNLPQSEKVSDLCRHLKARLSKFGSMIECARDFCRRNHIDEAKAEDLLRQAKRYPQHWRT